MDLGGIDARPPHDFLHHLAGELRRLGVGECATEGSDRRPRSSEYDDVMLDHV